MSAGKPLSPINLSLVNTYQQSLRMWWLRGRQRQKEEEEVKGDIPIRIDFSHRFPFLPHPLLISTIPSTKIKGCEGIVHWNQP